MVDFLNMINIFKYSISVLVSLGLVYTLGVMIIPLPIVLIIAMYYIYVNKPIRIFGYLTLYKKIISRVDIIKMLFISIFILLFCYANSVNKWYDLVISTVSLTIFIYYAFLYCE